jgi:hypothetical protein
LKALVEKMKETAKQAATKPSGGDQNALETIV